MMMRNDVHHSHRSLSAELFNRININSFVVYLNKSYVCPETLKREVGAIVSRAACNHRVTWLQQQRRCDVDAHLCTARNEDVFFCYRQPACVVQVSSKRIPENRRSLGVAIHQVTFTGCESR